MLYLYERFKQIHEMRINVTLRRLCIFTYLYGGKEKSIKYFDYVSAFLT